MTAHTLGDLARKVGGSVRGDQNVVIAGVGALQSAVRGQIAFLSNSKYRKFLQSTQASAVILNAVHAQECNTNALVVANPAVAYALVAAALTAEAPGPYGIHPTAVVAPGARVGQRVTIGPHCSIDDDAMLDDDVWVGAGCYVGRRVHVGAESRLEANVTLWHDTRIGRRALIHPGVVIGGDGFGLANDNGAWVKVPQLGRVLVGNDVEIGCNAAIDRGALEDTVIEDGVKIDNLVHIAHNVHIGAHTAIAACAAVAGSTKIGKYCGIGGMVGVVGHAEIADHVQITGMSMVTKSVSEPGIYSSGIPLEPNALWRKNVVRFKQLDDMWRRIKQLEAELQQLKGKG
jgi:UDP-3-O-[3-hydroxymyristoyl] glucosamine N-acyltransferase